MQFPGICTLPLVEERFDRLMCDQQLRESKVRVASKGRRDGAENWLRFGAQPDLPYCQIRQFGDGTPAVLRP
jgi:hypothetical protein